MTALRCVALLALLLLLAGCATTDQESELPWNMTQPWETAPSLPGGLGGPY
ncbi:MAG: hypothetical protein GX803_04615 [Lentisphaerae bacterium]|nr:hypothetical protein [Lentisphaerota bacterium]